jgi:hypothetical protein
MPPNKYTSYSPPAHLPKSPAKAADFNKLKPVSGYGDDGRCSSLKQTGYKNWETIDVVRFRDVDGNGNGKQR